MYEEEKEEEQEERRLFVGRGGEEMVQYCIPARWRRKRRKRFVDKNEIKREDQLPVGGAPVKGFDGRRRS